MPEQPENLKNTDPQAIEDLVNKSNHEIIKIKTVFPFTLFPTELIVDEVKVTIIFNYFLYRHYFPMLLKDIKAATIGEGIFFSSMKFEIQGYEDNPGIINYLWKEEAREAHKIIVGLTAVMKEKAEGALSSFSDTKRVEKLSEIGATTAHPPTPTPSSPTQPPTKNNKFRGSIPHKVV
jgi:hypothetical protein